MIGGRGKSQQGSSVGRQGKRQEESSFCEQKEAKKPLVASEAWRSRLSCCLRLGLAAVRIFFH
jgi:hypothetical protein